MSMNSNEVATGNLVMFPRSLRESRPGGGVQLLYSTSIVEMAAKAIESQSTEIHRLSVLNQTLRRDLDRSYRILTWLTWMVAAAAGALLMLTLL